MILCPILRLNYVAKYKRSENVRIQGKGGFSSPRSASVVVIVIRFGRFLFLHHLSSWFPHLCHGSRTLGSPLPTGPYSHYILPLSTANGFSANIFLKCSTQSNCLLIPHKIVPQVYQSNTGSCSSFRPSQWPKHRSPLISPRPPELVHFP